MRRSIVLIIAASALAAPSVASAATVALEPVGVDCHATCNDVNWALRYTARPGEANQPAVTQADDAYVVREISAPLEPGDGCVLVDPQTVRCEPTTDLAQSIGSFNRGGLLGGTIETGDGDDTIGVDVGRGFTLEGGDGDDRIGGGGGRDVITGGPGRDVLRGGGGRDDFVEGDGVADVIDGGRGGDGVSYAGRRDDLTIDLRGTTGPDGDAFASLEWAEGGSGDDRLHASPRVEWLDGGPGADVLIGSSAADWLIGGPGRDRLVGGAGRDRVSPRDGAPDVISCGDGIDLVSGAEDDGFGEFEELGPDAADVLGSDCERVSTEAEFEPAPLQVQPLSVAPTALRLRAPNCSCRGYVTVRVGGHRLGRARIERGRRSVTVVLARPLRSRGGPIRIEWSYGFYRIAGSPMAYSLRLRL